MSLSYLLNLLGLWNYITYFIIYFINLIKFERIFKVKVMFFGKKCGKREKEVEMEERRTDGRECDTHTER